MCIRDRMTPEEAKEHHPKVVVVDDENKIARVTNYEKHGKMCIRDSPLSSCTVLLKERPPLSHSLLPLRSRSPQICAL